MKLKLYLLTILSLFVITAFSQDISWAKKIGGTGDITPFKSITDNSGNIYIIGFYTGALTQGSVSYSSVSGSQDGFLAKFLPDGTLSWVQSIGGTLSEDIKGIALSNDQDTIYLVGTFQGTCTFSAGVTLTVFGTANGTNDDAFLAKFLVDGTFKNVYHFAKGYDAAQLTSPQRAVAIKVTSDDKLIIVGQFINKVRFLNEDISVAGNNLFIAKVNTNGTLIWRKLLTSTNNTSAITSCDLYANGIYVGGQFLDNLTTDLSTVNSNSAAKSDGFVLKTDLSGNGIFLRKIAGSESEFIISVSCDSIGQFYATGYFNSTTVTVDKSSSATQTYNNTSSATYDFFYSKYNANGTLNWFNPGGSTSSDNLYRTSSGAGFLVATGEMSGNLSVGGIDILNNGGKDAINLVQNYYGDLLYGFAIGGSGDEVGRTAIIDKSGNYIFIGDFTTTSLAISNTTLTNSGAVGKKDLYIAKYKKGSLEKIKTNISCNGLSDGKIIVTPKGPLTPPYHYVWKKNNVSFGTDTSVLDNLSAATYTVHFYDAASTAFDIFDTIVVSEPTAIGLSAATTQVKCAGSATGAINLTVSGGTQRTGAYKYYFDWTSSDGSGLKDTLEDQSNIGGGHYSVVVSDKNGCTVTSPTYTINSPAGLPLSVTATCTPSSGLDGTANAVASGGIGSYTYLWSPGGATTASITGLAPNTYSVTAKDDSLCSASTTVTVQLLALSTVKTDVTCFNGTNGSATVTVSGGTPGYTYSWSNGGTSATISGVVAGTYTVTVTDAAGVPNIATISVTITQPAQLTATLVPTHVKCAGGNSGKVDLTIAGGTMPYTQTWSNAATSEDISNLTAGPYSVTVSDKNSCTVNYSPSNSVTVLDTSSFSGSISTTSKTCYGSQGRNNGTAISLISGGKTPYSYLWNNGKTTSSISNLSAGTYSVTVKDANNCSITPASKVVSEGPEIKGSITENHPSCGGASDGILEYKSSTNKWGNGLLTYLWNNSGTPITDSITTGLPNATYSITVTDASDCVYTLSKSLSNLALPSAAGSITGSSTVCQNLTGQIYSVGSISNASIYNWTLPTGVTISSGDKTTSIVTDISGTAASGNITVEGSNVCGTGTASALGLTVNNPPVILTQPTNPSAICSGSGGATFTVELTATSTGPFSYVWEEYNNSSWATVSNGGIYSGANTNSLQLTNPTSALNGYKYRVKVTGACSPSVTSDGLATLTVNNPQPVSVSIVSDLNNVCAGTSVTFTATPTNGGASPIYQWKRGASNVGTGLSTYTYSPTNGDIISCVLTSSATCISGSPATSGDITMVVNPNLPVSVSISGSSASVCSGTSVTYTATPTNGGATPSYQWKVNGSNVGSDQTTYSYSPTSGDAVTCVLTSNALCATGNPATSNSVSTTVNPNLPVSVSISGSSASVCSGTSVTYTATPTNGGATPSYQWKVNGSNVGTNQTTYSYSPTSGDAVTCVLTSNATCATGNPATSNSVSTTVNPNLPVSVSISGSSASVCSGTSVTYTATPTNGGATPSYQWKVNGSNVGTNQTTYSYSPTSGDAVTCVLTSNATCATGNPATSNSVSTTVNPNLPVSVSISGSSASVCSGTSVTYTATPTNGGATPSYQWKVNGSNVGTNQTTYSYSPTSGDAVTCVLTSNATCATGNPATSNSVSTTVNPNLPVSVSISGSSASVCSGTSVTYTATPTNGGATPSYQWKVNGSNVGTNQTTYSYSPTSGDAVTCVLTSNATCATGNPATSNSVSTTVNPNLPVSVSISGSSASVCSGTSVTYTATPTNGGATPSYQWKVNGSNVGTNQTTYSYSPTSGDAVTCVLTSNATCATGNPATSNSVSTTVNPNLPVSVSISGSSASVCSGTSVTYTATPTNGGATPSYQWKVNGSNVGTNQTTYSYSPTSGDAVTCVLTSNATCATGSPATSTAVNMVVSSTLTPNVSVSVSANAVCENTSVIFTAVSVNGGSTPSYQWQVNGVNAGANLPTLDYIPVNNDVVSCILTSSLSCATSSSVTSNTLTMSVSPLLTSSVSIIASGNSICENTSVTFTATPVNEGSAPDYQWKVNGTNVGTNLVSYSYTPINGDVVSCELTSNATCATGNPASSNSVAMIVNPNLPVSLSILESANSVCENYTVTYTAAPTNGGATPSYQWKVNGTNVGTNLASYSYTPINGDVVSCELTSDATCATGNPASSNSVTMVVYPLVPVSVIISQLETIVCSGSSVTINASIQNGGTSPIYNWFVNGSSAGTNSNSYLFFPANGDLVTCELSSNIACPVLNPVTSNPLSMNVRQDFVWNSPVVSDASSRTAKDGSIQVSVSGGLANKFYTLNPGKITNSTGNFVVGAGNYIVVITDESLCDTLISDVINVSYPLAIPENDNLSSVTAFPNPTNEFIQLKYSNGYTGLAKLEIYSITGAKVFTKLLTISPNVNINEKISVSDLQNGVYIIKLNGSILKDKLIVQ